MWQKPAAVKTKFWKEVKTKFGAVKHAKKAKKARRRWENGAHASQNLRQSKNPSTKRAGATELSTDDDALWEDSYKELSDDDLGHTGPTYGW
jgi:hypothetical protein